MAHLTKRAIDTFTPDPKREIRLWDDTPRGLFLRVKPSGAQTFGIQYRSPLTDKKTRVTIGQYGRLTLEQARIEARKQLAMVARGEDPADAKRKAREKARATAVTVATLCEEYMRDARIGMVTYRGKAKKAGTLDIDQGRIKRHIVPLLGDKLVREVTTDDVVSFMHNVRLGKTAVTEKTGPRGVARVSGGDGTARRTVGLLGSIFSYSMKRGVRPDNPVAGVEKSPDGKRDRVLNPDEYHRLGEALDTLEREGANRVAVVAVRVLALTGSRKGEIFGLRWSEVDAHRQCLRFGDSKTGQQVRPVGRAALEALAETRKAESPLVFPAGRGEGSLTDTKVFHRACKLAGLEEVTPHVLRHSFASAALELEYSELTIAGLLGHRSHSVTARYSHHVDRALVAAADRVSALIARRMEGTDEQGAVVVPLATA
jgi:integrase